MASLWTHSAAQLRYLIYHIFLPSQLPTKDDSENQALLLGITASTLVSFKDLVPGTVQPVVDQVLRGFRSAHALHGSSGNISSEPALLSVLSDLKSPLPLLVSAQNTGLLINKTTDGAVIIEEFELSPINNAVNDNKGRLVRSFPALALSIDGAVFNQAAFLKMVSQTLFTLSYQSAPGMQPQSSKSGHDQDETRDTTHPGMISEFFMNLLKPAGNAVAVPAVSKNTREEVIWSNSKFPWRRSPLWLLIRVTLQLLFSRSSSPNLYKQFMVFLMSSVLQSAHHTNLPSDILFAMNAKIARRLLKLNRQENSIHDSILVAVHKALSESDAQLCGRWKEIQKQDKSMLDLKGLETLQFEDDFLVSVPELDEYLLLLQQRQTNLEVKDFVPTPKLAIFSSEELPSVPASASGDRAYDVARLQGFEDWVSSNLDLWVCRHMDEQSCITLADTLQSYHAFASVMYANNPEGLSLMLLNVFELWVAVDKIATRVCPLLEKYDPDVPIQVLENLILPFKYQMVRVDKIESYVTVRCNKTRLRANQLLYATKSEFSFAAQYFDQSTEHQELHTKINAQAEEEKAQKLSELRQLKGEYARLESLIESTQDETERVVDPYTDEVRRRCVRDCKRCKYIAEQNALTIAYHEWPLPNDKHQAKSVVFELKACKWLTSWRDSTAFLLQNVLGGKPVGQNPRMTFRLPQDCHLSKYFQQGPASHRIGLLSEDKPHVVTHWNGKQIGLLREADVCVKNGLNYQYFDNSTQSFYKGFLYDDQLSKTCTYQLQNQTLQKFIYRPATMPDGPPPNVVIASQHECPSDMALQEFKELCSLPLGHHLQWENILLQLAMPSVDFKKLETTLIVLQCLLQAGPRSVSSMRSGHQKLSDNALASKTLGVLNIALNRVKENWESSQAVNTFCAIAARVLTLTPSPDIQISCLSFLDRARYIVFDWMQLLKNKAHEATDPTDHTFFVSKSKDLALICVTSFDVDREHLPRILDTTKVTSILLQCSIVIQEGQRSQQPDSRDLLSMRCSRILYRCLDLLTRYQLGLDDAISASWSGYSPGSLWHSVSPRCPEWVTYSTSGAGLRIHYNLLTGELLVNGLPLDRPPRHYEAQKLFHALFDHHAVEVMPTAVLGMQFSTKKKFHGYSVQMGMTVATDRMTSELVVQASKDTSTWETIPKRLLVGKYPPHFTDKYTHWYDFTEKVLEFRPTEAPWDATSAGVWRLSKDASTSKWQLQREDHHLIGLNSKTSLGIASILEPLCTANHIHISLNPANDAIEIDIPQLEVTFSLNKASSVIQSKQFRGMHIDEDQSLGTLHGLQNKLLLKHGQTASRQVLLPEAQVSYTKLTGPPTRISVQVAKDLATKLHVFDVDAMLGRLIDNGSLHSKLFLAYLHALTSFCLPDSLTGKTGTEQALLILSSAAVRSFNQLSEADAEVLEKIARLTPKRNYYPSHLHDMQEITWDNTLSFLTQRGEFADLISTLLNQASATRVLYPEVTFELPRIDVGNWFLLSRDLIRSSTFKVASFGAEKHSTTHDKFYNSRDRDQSSQRAQDVYCLSKLVYSEVSARHWFAAGHGYLWKAMSELAYVAFIVASDIHLNEVEYMKDKSFILQHWPSLHEFLTIRQNAHDHKLSFMVWLATMVWGRSVDVEVLQSLAMMVTTNSGVSQVDFPGSLTTMLFPHAGLIPKSETLHTIIRKHLRSFYQTDDSTLTKRANESIKSLNKRRLVTYNQHVNDAVQTVSQALLRQWPTRDPNAPGTSPNNRLRHYINVDAAMPALKKAFATCSDNVIFNGYLTNVENAVLHLDLTPIVCVDIPLHASSRNANHRGYVAVQDLFAVPAPVVPAQTSTQINSLLIRAEQLNAPREESPRLSALVDELASATTGSRYETNYAMELRESLVCLQARRESAPLQDDLNTYRELCEQLANETYAAIMKAVVPTLESRSRLTIGLGSYSVKQWPRLCPTFFLQQLARKQFDKLPPDWRTCLIKYGLALVELQKADRLIRAAALPTTVELLSEINNIGHQNWDPLEFPDSLLMEIETGMIIRRVQEDIANKMRNPPSGENSVMQLNMGEGKSSVIVPMVATALADGSRLVRVIVAKPRSKQMAQMLISKLGGLLGRRVYYLPFSRSIKLEASQAAAINTMTRECMKEGGILLVQPEHILPFKLMGVESIIAGKNDIGTSLLETQDFFDQSSRDIVDESDENFSVKFELIYTMGTQRQMELSPDRWILIQQILTLVEVFGSEVFAEFPQSLLYRKSTKGQFSRVRILRQDAEHALVKRIAQHICAFGLESFPIGRQSAVVRDAVYTYITKYELDEAEIANVEGSPFWTELMRPTILLLRGLLGGGILAFTVSQKRWRVNYGLTKRIPATKLAVPYRAKDNPTARSEFSHPDVVIVLTCLSYYYGGLEDTDLFATFFHLAESDQRHVEYANWVRDSGEMPASFHSFDGINLRDRTQCMTQIFPHLRQSKSAVDYFLTHVVFPKEMKEFPSKLSSSGWDIAKVKRHPTTGFSGTKDSRALLPISVKYLDLPGQRHTDAFVLEYLLQPQNSVSLMPPAFGSTSSDAEQLLMFILGLKDEVQVILDVGAQIIEMNNVQVATTWLRMHHDNKKEGVVFCNDNDELCVIDRKGRVEFLQTSSFLSRLDVCLVFLDEAHTRGIDLKLPQHFRAAVTLGDNLTKDKLVQACMRMRKLGKGQTVEFCVSEEIQTKIRGCVKIVPEQAIAVKDVLMWSVNETFVDTRRSMPLWAVQGERYVNHELLWREASAQGHTTLTKEFAERFLEEEAQSVDRRYRPRIGEDQALFAHLEASGNADIKMIASRCRDFEDLQFRSNTLREEQERELSPEIQQERQIQHPDPAQPAIHRMHPDVLAFWSNGTLLQWSRAYMPAFQVLQETSATTGFEVARLGNNTLFATDDFASTVLRSGTGFSSDQYQRHVQWLLTSHSRDNNEAIQQVLIISPFEANELRDRTDRSPTITLHLYKPQTNLNYASLDKLDLHSIPTRLTVLPLPRPLAIQLNLFAGQLYFSSYQDYLEICKFLGLAAELITAEMAAAGWAVAADGFIMADGEGRFGGESELRQSPLKFIKTLMTKIRRNGQGIDKTDIGSLLEGKLFQRGDFDR